MIPIIAEIFNRGISGVPSLFNVLKYVSWLVVIFVMKWYFGGAVNKSERNMHGKVVMITGGTSGIGAHVAEGLAKRGAQLVLLTQHALSDPFMVDYVMDLRLRTNNQLITAECVNLASLHSIRQFATKWVDNAPPRRLDMIILCANNSSPGKRKVFSEDGLEYDLAVNYLSNFHLLSILSPAIRAQPPDRDVRIIFGTCSSYLGGSLPNFAEHIAVDGVSQKQSKKEEFKSPNVATYTSSSYQISKLSLMIFATAFQKLLNAYVRPDKHANNARVVMVDPGWSRTPGMRRHISNGSLLGLFLYLLTWPVWWLVLKSPEQGAQTFLYAAMEANWGKGEGGKFLKECREMLPLKNEIFDEAIQKKLWEASEKTIETLEKQGALKRAQAKKEATAKQKQ
ncbi:NAD(P)-binding protein [Pseudovirgaria hyperparasitica]|uniref:NAD(P)-binding protein n=1 Tax=Pseudovirgaria hyperparasitica TaxID=470096 RepID=A0A6A6WG86_9PEZI|nr:NAD(P)-binding protein [Pseudovirgaria hyperparasitica]KAF2761783.1 NAD(P)-binding protein [Pseudovirgaria hyperparasitica]